MALTGLVAIVTGATKGMGLAIAERFAAQGGRLVVCSRSAQDVAQLVDSLNARFGHGEQIAVGLRCDIEVKAETRELVDLTLATFGKIDALICSASTLPWFGSTLAMPDEAIDQQFRAVFLSKFWLSSLVIPPMVEAGGGSIVYIGSGSVAEATTERSLYACARAAELQMMKNLAAEFGPSNIRVNTVSPGMIRSFQTAPLFDDEENYRRFSDRVPMRRGGEPEEIAAAVCFLAGPESSYTTGCVITVDGGRLLHARPKQLTGVLTANAADQKRGLG